MDGNAYSLFMVDEFSKAKILVTNDSLAIGEEGKVKVRLINLSPDASPVSLGVKEGTGAIVERQAFKSGSQFVSIDPGKYDFEIISSGTEAPLVVPDLDLQSGAVRTIVLRGYRNPPAGNTNVVSAQVLIN